MSYPPENSEETLQRFYDSASVLMGTVELTADDIVHVSDNLASATFFDTTPEAMRGRSARAMGVPETYAAMWLHAYQTSLTSPEPVRFDYEHKGKGWLSVTVNYIGRNEDGRQRFLYVVVDITDRKRIAQELQEAHDQLEARVKQRTVELTVAKRELEIANDQLQRQAYYDTLTGLPNRALFNDRLRHALERYRSNPDLGFAVLFLDLDRFKVINDSLGHPAGDALLVAVGKRLSACVRTGDTVARFGGDEFTVLLEHCDAARATEIVWRIRQALKQPFSVMGRSFNLSGSVGIVFSEKGYDQPQDLLRDADLAMYRAKASRSGQHQVFESSMHDGAVQRLDLEEELRQALKGTALKLYYQPIVCLADLRLVGFEALVRWQHPALGLLTPDAFVPLAEETGLIAELDRHVLRSACRQLALWRAQSPHFADLSVNVNFSSQGFLQQGLARDVEQILLQNDLDPSCLNLEITETLLMHPAAVVDRLVAQLVTLGVGVCIDDFGTGYASLSYLRRFQATGLKVERSFVQDMNKDERGVILVEGIATIAKNLGMRVVAEGVETKKQLEQLRTLGCDYGQGYLFAKPLTVAEASAFITSKGVAGR